MKRRVITIMKNYSGLQANDYSNILNYRLLFFRKPVLKSDRTLLSRRRSKALATGRWVNTRLKHVQNYLKATGKMR